MIDALMRLFKPKNRADLAEIVRSGALILDVRNPTEFMAGHIKGAMNIPAELVQRNLLHIPRDRAVVLCCASGTRSAMAYRILKACGYDKVYDGGSWMSLQRYK